MPRRNFPRNRQVRVTREVYALAELAIQRAQRSEDDFLAERTQSSRRISRRMLKALRSQAV